jgi:hypothetical protein
MTFFSRQSLGLLNRLVIARPQSFTGKFLRQSLGSNVRSTIMKPRAARLASSAPATTGTRSCVCCMNHTCTDACSLPAPSSDLPFADLGERLCGYLEILWLGSLCLCLSRRRPGRLTG